MMSDDFPPKLPRQFSIITKVSHVVIMLCFSCVALSFSTALLFIIVDFTEFVGLMDVMIGNLSIGLLVTKL